MPLNIQRNDSSSNSTILRLVDAGPVGPATECPHGFAGIGASMIRAEREAVIVAQGDPAGGCHLVVAGCLRTVALMHDGRRQIGEFLFPGDLFGWEALDEHGFGAEAVTRVVLRRYACPALRRLPSAIRISLCGCGFWPQASSGPVKSMRWFSDE